MLLQIASDGNLASGAEMWDHIQLYLTSYKAVDLLKIYGVK